MAWAHPCPHTHSLCCLTSSQAISILFSPHGPVQASLSFVQWPEPNAAPPTLVLCLELIQTLSSDCLSPSWPTHTLSSPPVHWFYNQNTPKTFYPLIVQSESIQALWLPRWLLKLISVLPRPCRISWVHCDSLTPLSVSLYHLRLPIPSFCGCYSHPCSLCVHS